MHLSVFSFTSLSLFAMTLFVRRFAILTSFLLTSLVSLAQTGTIKGFVYDKASGEPVIYTNVILQGTRFGVQTDLNGYFSITKVPPGNYTLFTTNIGFDTATVEVTVEANKVITQKLYLATEEIELGTVEVNSRKTEKKTLINTGVTPLTPKDIKRLPSFGGEPDITQYLQMVPGVVLTGDQGGQLYIRGGSPAQTGILLDGVTIYNPFHSIGLFSVFETDAIRSADVYTAGFSAEFGDRTSAIVDIHTKDGNNKNLSGKLSASTVMSRVMLEGPIAKPKKQGDGAVTFLVSAKYSYLDETSKTIYKGLRNPDSVGLPYNFTDLYGKITISGANGSKVNFFAFNFNDNAKIINPSTYHADASFGWTATGGGTTFILSPSGSSTLIDGKLAYSNYNLNFNETNFRPRSTGIDGFEGAINFTYFLPAYSQIKYGIEVSGYHTSLDYVNTYGYGTLLDRRHTLASFFLVYRKNFSERFVFEPSLRIQYYASLSKFSPEPRLGIKYNITDKIRFKASAGLYSQNIVSTKNDRDIVNFFTGFLLSPDEQIRDGNGNVIGSNLETAYHLVAGIEADAGPIEFNLEPWFKNFTRNIELNRYKLFINDPNFIVETGKAYGVDLSGKYNHQRIYLYGVFSYQYVDRNDGQQTYPPPFDRRFNMNLLGSYTFGKKKSFDVSVRYALGSPFPFTQTQGFYENLNLLNNGISTNYLQQNGNLGLLYASAINGGRLSWFHRLDISAVKRFRLSSRSSLEATASVSNVYDRNNIFYVDRIANTRVYQLPVFPSLALNFSF